jgi:hypothetical protein
MRAIQRLGLAALALLAACADRGLLEPDPAAVPLPNAQRFECIARVREQTVTCAAPAPVSPSLRRGVIIGGQGQYVKLTTTNVAWNAGTGIFSGDVTVQNLLPYAMGTQDGVSPDPAGIRVFFHTGPTVTSGWGTATVQNPDGVGAFTATSQPWFQYPGILAPGQTSAAKSWRFHLDPDVAYFAFTLFVSAHTSPTLVISEIMAHPSTAGEPAGEWFEVHNRSFDPIDLQGWTITSGGDAPHTITGSVVVMPRGYVVLGASADSTANGGARVHYVYGGIDLANGTTDWVALRAPAGFTADSVDWSAASAETASPPPTGASLELDSLDNDNLHLSGASSPWTVATASFGSGQKGTPGSQRLVPLQAVSIAVTRLHACAVDADGQGWCWGKNSFGELGIGIGDGFEAYFSPPHTIPQRVRQPAGVSFTQVSVGEDLTCALATTGQPYCWGWQVPLPTGRAQRTTPWPIALPPGVTFVSLDVGGDFYRTYDLCAVDTTGQVWCWGPTQLTPAPLATPEPVAQLAVDGSSICVRSGAGNIYCKSIGVDIFVVVRQPGVTFKWFDSSAQGCGVSSIGQIQCWPSWALDEVTPNVTLPATIRFSSLSLGYVYDICAVATTGQVYCGGDNESGQLGDGTRSPHSLAPVAQPAGVLFSSVAMSRAGRFHDDPQSFTCALQQGSGNVYCWGANSRGQLGDGTTTDRLVPVPVYR